MKRKTALITGAALRIGAAVARYLHGKDIDVLIHYHTSETAAAELVHSLNGARAGSALAAAADLSAADCDYGALIDAALRLNARLDMLINNASVFYPTPVGDITEAHWRELAAVNLKAPLFLSQAAAPHLRRQRGCIVNIADIHGARPLRAHPLYSVTQAGLIMLTRALAKELAPAIRVNAVSPGAILWPADMPPETRASILRRVPLQTPGDPADIAKAVHFLAVAADYTTGQVLDIDGGRGLSA